MAVPAGRRAGAGPEGGPAASVLVVMTYNVAAGLAPPDRLLRLLRESEADVVGLQELAPAQAAAIERGLSDRYPYQFLHPLGIPGKGLLSRFPLRDPELLELYPARPDLRATVAAPGEPLAVVVAHPPPPRFGPDRRAQNTARREQLAALVAATAAGGPTVLLGDLNVFNLVDRHETYQRLAAAGLIDAFASAGRGSGATLPMRLARWAHGRNPVGRVPLIPVFRVDYIWHTPHFRALAAWRGGHAGSDHRPVLARLVSQPARTPQPDPIMPGGAARGR